MNNCKAQDGEHIVRNSTDSISASCLTENHFNSPQDLLARRLREFEIKRRALNRREAALHTAIEELVTTRNKVVRELTELATLEQKALKEFRGTIE